MEDGCILPIVTRAGFDNYRQVQLSDSNRFGWKAKGTRGCLPGSLTFDDADFRVSKLCFPFVQYAHACIGLKTPGVPGGG